MNSVHHGLGSGPWIHLTNLLEEQGISIDSIGREERTETEVDPTLLESYLETKNFAAIFGNSDLFWKAYCKAVIESNGVSSTVSFVYSQENRIKISGTEGDLETLQSGIENLREFFRHGLQVRATIQIVLAKKWNLHMKKYAEVIDLRRDTDGIPSFLYLSSIKPVFPKLAMLFDCIFEEEATRFRVETNRRTFLQENAAIIRFRWREPIYNPPTYLGFIKG